MGVRWDHLLNVITVQFLGLAEKAANGRMERKQAQTRCLQTENGQDKTICGEKQRSPHPQ